MKTNLFNWENEFLVEKYQSLVLCYDTLLGLHSISFNKNTFLTTSVKTNRSKEFINIIAFLTFLFSKKMNIKKNLVGFEKKNKGQENKYNYLFSTNYSSKFFLYIYFYILIFIFNQKKMTYSTNLNFVYNTQIKNLNLAIKVNQKSNFLDSDLDLTFNLDISCYKYAFNFWLKPMLLKK